MKRCLLIILVAFGLLPFAGCPAPIQDIATFKEELKREILAELRQQRQTTAQVPAEKDQEQLRAQMKEERAQMKEEIEAEVMAKIQSQVQSQVQAIASESRQVGTDNRSVQWQAVPVGSAEGLFLRNDKPLPECKVKLVRILKPQSVIDMFNTIREGAEFMTVTDEDGKYHFDKLPVGAYKLKWQLPRDKGWIRRLRDKPDAVITEGRTTVLKSVETNRRLVAQ